MTYPSSIINVIKEFDITADKKYGQCFLIDNNALDKIADSAQIRGDELVIEIGSGPGNLTARLCSRASYVVAFETDINLFKIYDKYFKGLNVSFNRMDFLKADLDKIISAAAVDNNLKFSSVRVVANIPYYITSQIIEKLLYSNIAFSGIYLLIQRDVADRIASQPGCGEYGILSVACALKSRVSIIRKVPGTCFYPVPEVESALVKLEPFDRFSGAAFNEEIFFAIVKSAFNQRRKVAVSAVANNIARIGEINRYDGGFLEFLKARPLKTDISNIFEKLSISKLARAEEISCEGYISIARELEALWASNGPGKSS